MDAAHSATRGQRQAGLGAVRSYMSHTTQFVQRLLLSYCQTAMFAFCVACCTRGSVFVDRKLAIACSFTQFKNTSQSILCHDILQYADQHRYCIGESNMRKRCFGGSLSDNDVVSMEPFRASKLAQWDFEKLRDRLYPILPAATPL